MLDTEPLSRFLSCPIILDEPDRVVWPPEWLEHIPFAFWIVEALRPTVFVELGTHSGNSYAAFAQAIQRLREPASSFAVDTWRGDPHAGFYDETVFAEWSAYHDRRFSSFSRLVRSTFAEAAEHFADRSVDLLHIDGYHTFDAISEDFELWRPKMSSRGVVLLHDINVRERGFGVWQFWERIRTEYPSFAFHHSYGLGVLGVGSDCPEPVTWLLSHARVRHGELATIRSLFACLGGAIAARYAGALPGDAGESSARLAAAEAEIEQLRALQSRHQARRLLDEANERLAGGDRSAMLAELARAFGRIAQLDGENGRALADLARTRRQADVLRRQLQDREEQLAAGASHLEQVRLEASRTLAEALSHKAREIDRLQELASAAVAEAKVRARQQVASIEASRTWRLTAPLREAARRIRRPETVAQVLFDATYYLELYPEARASGLDPLADYLEDGWRAHRNPHPLFDTAFYLQRYPDVAASGWNPLIHYLSEGGHEGRDPHPLFQARYYLDRNADVSASGMNPLVHFVHFGGAEGRNPHPAFDAAFYLARNADVAEAHLNPLVHFVTHGAAEGRDPNAHFVTAYYVRENPDAAARGGNPLVHYLQSGQPNGRRCCPPAPHE